MTAARALGRGISALMDEAPVEGVSFESGERVQKIAIEQLRPGKYQPRLHFDDAALRELSDSIRQIGVMQPLIVRPLGDGFMEIIAGERRWRASRLAGLLEVPAIVKPYNDKEALEAALIENIQRQDLNALEESEGYQRLMDEFGYTQESVAQIVGKSRSHVANLLRLLQLPGEVKTMLAEGRLSVGHARALLTAEQPVALAEEVIARGLNVRQTERFAQGLVSGASPRKKNSVSAAQPMLNTALPVGKSEDILALEEALSANIGLSVEIQDAGQKGAVVLRYETLAQLDDILRRLGGV